MKNPYEVIRMKEQELLIIRKEIEALKYAARLIEAAEDRLEPDSTIQSRPSRVVEMP